MHGCRAPAKHGPTWGHKKALSEMTSTAINPVYQSVTDSYAKKLLVIERGKQHQQPRKREGKASILKLIILCKLGKLTAVS